MAMAREEFERLRNAIFGDEVRDNMTGIYLTDDGTLDTVLECEGCGEQFRYNYMDAFAGDETHDSGSTGYDDFIDWAIEDAKDIHDCGGDA